LATLLNFNYIINYLQFLL